VDAGWIREAYITILNREPDAAGLEYWANQLSSGSLSQEDIIANLLNSEEAASASGMGIFTIPGPGQTRYCLDPWRNVVVKADGSVLPCCSHPPVGRVSADCGLEQVLDGDTMRALRHSLLSGRLDPSCARCRNQPAVDVGHFRRDFALTNFVAGKVVDGAGYIDLTRNPDVARTIQFTGAEAGFHGLGAEVFLQPTKASPLPAVTFRDIEVTEPSVLHVEVSVRDADASMTGCCISVSGDRVNTIEARLKTPQCITLTLEIVPSIRPVSVTYSARSLARDKQAAVYFSYPFFDFGKLRDDAIVPAAMGEPFPILY